MSVPAWLRPSMLPKLAKCGDYRPEEVPGDAAARGTTMDVAFREAIGGNDAKLQALEALDKTAVIWAVDTARALAAGAGLISKEEDLRIEALGMTGTADLLCPDGLWSVDLKTGQVRNYDEQQAEYALGFMDSHFVDEWKVYLIFCDQQELVSRYFTRESADAIVRGVIAKAVSGEPPTPNEYCGWCAKRFECQPRRETLGLIPLDEFPLFEQVPSELLRAFVIRAGTIEDFAVKGREIIKSRILAGEKIAGCSLVSKRGSRKAPERLIELNLSKLGTGDVLAAYGPMSEAKLKEIWARKLPDVPFPEDQLTESPGSSYVRVSAPKS